MNLEIIKEEKDYLVVMKPAGMVVHVGDGGKHDGETLVDEVREYLADDFEDMTRPGIVHRLDKDTSGVMVVARNQAALEHFVEQFKQRKVKKAYSTLVRGVLEHEEAVIDSPIARSTGDRKKMGLAAESVGKEAVTRYKVVEAMEGASLLRVQIETGRTHQIRVHMQAIGHPVIGDKVYGDRQVNARFLKLFGLKRQFLHAAELCFVDPAGEKVEIKTDLPGDLFEVLERFYNY